MRKVRLGIIGCGVIGTAHLQATRDCDFIEVVAVADLIAERRECAAAACGTATAFASGAALLESPQVEAVVLAVPAGDRIDLPLQAMARGKHVLIEKPVALNAAMLEKYQQAQGALVAGCCSSRFQTLPSTQAAADVIASGVLGPLRNIHCRVLVPSKVDPAATPIPWRLNKERNAGGILCNWGCYDLDYLMAITGWSLCPRMVMAQTWGVTPAVAPYVAPHSDAESFYTAFIRFDGGTVLTLTRGEYMAISGEAAWQVIGEHGSLRLHMTPDAGKTIYHDTYTPPTGVTTRVVWEGSEDGGLLHRGPVQDFARAILDGTSPRTDLQRVMTLQRITDAIYASAALGSSVELP